MLRQEQEKRDKIIKKKMLEERWEMTKWITKYIDENEDRWAREKKEGEESVKKWQEDWARMTRREKIRIIKEKEIDKKQLNVTIWPEGLKLQKCSGDSQAEQRQGQAETESQESQAEQKCSVDSRAEPCTG